MMIEKFDINNPEHFDRTKYKIVKWENSGRKPSDVHFGGSFKEDASRRDFSFNALGLTSSGEIIDYFNGKQDLDSHIIKTVGCPYDRFGEDFLRVMRLIRLAVKLDLEIDECTAFAAEDCSIFINKISIERIVDELFKIASLNGKKLSHGIKLLDKFGILQNILPELTNLKNFKQNIKHHPEGAKAFRILKNNKISKEFEEYDKEKHNEKEYYIENGTVWDHTLEALNQSESTNPIENLAILFHDIGKPATFVKKGEKYTYYGHDNIGVEIFENVAKRLKLPLDVKDTILFCIKHHMRCHKIFEMKPVKVYKLITSKYWDTLLFISKCDILSRKFATDLDKWNKNINKIENIKNEWINKNSEILSSINGRRVMEVSGVETGPKVGIILKNVKEWVINGNISDEKLIDNKIKQIAKSI